MVSDGRIRTSAPITPIRRLPGDSAPLGVINTAVSRGGKEVHSRGGGGTGPQGPIPIKKKIQEKNPKEKIVWDPDFCFQVQVLLFPPIFTEFKFFKSHFRGFFGAFFHSKNGSKHPKDTARGPCRSDHRIGIGNLTQQNRRIIATIPAPIFQTT